jgi:hypothetical protein
MDIQEIELLRTFDLKPRSKKTYTNIIKKIILLILCLATTNAQLVNLEQNNSEKPAAKKCTVIMTLQKQVYKKFEPVIAKFDVINRNNKAYNIHDLFSPAYGGIGNLKITNDSGKVWNSQLIIDIIYIAEPEYFIQPGDTFTISMPINDWGNEISFNELYFGQLGYFPPGRSYTAYYYDESSKSSEVQFKVIDLNEEDQNVINIYKDFGRITADSSNSIIISKYPDNVFTEYIMTERFKMKYWKMFQGRNHYDATGLEEDYQNFFKKYPDSYYMYNDFFMAPYYAKLLSGLFSSYNKVIKEIKSKNNNSQLTSFLSNRDIKNRIKNVIKKLL